MGLRLLHSSAIFAAVSGTSLTASAADEPPPVADPPAAAAPTAPATPPEAPNEGHFRWGLSPMFGTFFPGPTTFALGMEGRVGWAFNQTISVYGSLGGVAGIGIGASTSSSSVSGSVSSVSYWYVGANVDALLVGPLFVGAGAALGKSGWGVLTESATTTGGGQEVISAGGLTPSVGGRLGIITGLLSSTGKRSGFSVALDVRVLIAPNSTTTKQTVGTGGVSQSVVNETTAIGVSPMLLLGYELR